MKSSVSFRCIWLCFKALSGGVLLIAIGVGMTVFGFYADTFAVQEHLDEATNRTVSVVNEHLKLHIHNLTYVGPVFMGIGGMLIVAACVLTFDGKEDDPTRASRNRRPSDAEGTEQLLLAVEASSKTERCNGPVSPFICLDAPPASIPDKGGGGTEVVTVAEVARNPATIPNGPSRARPQLPLPVRSRNDAVSPSEATQPPSSSSSLQSPVPRVAVRQPPKRRKSHFLSPLFDEFVPSPQDIQILDPDGCTPDAGCALEMDVFSNRTTKCPPRLQLEPRYLASIESDGLSDSDTAESEFTLSGAGSSGVHRGRFCDIEEQDIPLLGRCSPPSSPEYPMEPLLKRDRTGLRRFQLMRQAPNSRTLFDGPSSEGGSR
ncbi:uncharacterized protein LOC129225574 [Uloborus diversus]|uniref:uncharacterized protein LOC129225574 n=1 Tax=Uloborus diversus TaxID=327109 RepID=UPI0024098411|nr:uncharacterized protein LOC129225574 [Uloborus diversus]